MMTSGEVLPSDCCRTQTKWSDSSVHELKPIEAGCILVSSHSSRYCTSRRPTFVRYAAYLNADRRQLELLRELDR